MFENIFTKCIDNSELFPHVLRYAKLLKANPDNMFERINFKQFCEANNLPVPEFPKEQSIFISPHEMFDHLGISTWLDKAKTINWHEHNNMQQFHINCNCKCSPKFPLCSPIGLRQDTFHKMLSQSIKYRGELFVHNKQFNKCLKSKIQFQKVKIQLIQFINSNECFYIDIFNFNVQI